MNRVCVALSWFLLLGMVGSFSVLSLLDARIARGEKAEVVEVLRQSLRGYANKLDLNRSQLEAQLRELKRGYDDLRGELAKLRSASQVPTDTANESGESAPALTATEPADADRSQGESLPPLPVGVNPEQFVKTDGLDLKAVVEDPRYNPAGKEPTRVEKLRMVAEIKRASALMEVLDAEVRVAIADGMEQLRSRGEYIDYAPGEKYQHAPGVLTAAEQIENNGTRMFYLQPQDFPELYAKKKERNVVAERGVRRVLAQLQPNPLEAATVNSATGQQK